ncbi:hypothetical protein CBS9595_003465 [Malassezia furfur]|nr:hypothetical protein CBS9595_003465 [Malassezia furfur]
MLAYVSLALSLYALVTYLLRGAGAPPAFDADAVPIYLRAPSQGYAPAFPTHGAEGAVTCEVDVCSYVGAYLLSKGGSASDAATGASACVGVIHPYHSGIGGGGFALVKTNRSEPVMVDYLETAPEGAHRTMFLNTSKEEMGLAVAVPGEVRGWQAMHALYGRLPWAELLEPAIEIARRGFRIPPQLKYAMDTLGDKLCEAPRLGDIYCPGGVMKALGDTVRLPALADTLEQIAVQGPDAFYSGPIAERTVATVRERGGIMDLADLQRFRVLFRSAQSIDYRGRYRIWSTTAPSSGAVLLSALRTLENYPDRPYDRHNVLQTHRAIEAAKFAYGERTRYGDPAYLSNVSAYEHDALSEEGGRTRFTKIDDTRTFPASYYNPSYEDSGEDHGTSHLNAVDATGMAVSITTTVNLWWGSLVQTPDGILLNDDMDDFSTPGTPNKFGYKPSRANYIEPRKRPLSSMSPLLIESLPSGETQLIAGSAGGSRIITANLQMAYTYLSHYGRVDMQEVIRHPRWHHQLMPAETYFETVAGLAALGHTPAWIMPGSSAAQAIQRLANGSWATASESRQPEARGGAV